MPKNIEDIIPGDKNLPATRQGKSIRDIPIPEGRRRKTTDIEFPDRRETPDRRASTKEAYEVPVHIRSEPRMPRVDRETEEPVREFAPRGRRDRRKGPGKRVWIASLVSLAVLAFAIMSLFGGATLAYTPKSLPLAFAGDTYVAVKTGDSGLLFSVVKLTVDKGEEVSATGEEQVTEKASGSIIVYNNTTSEQKLIATTRFESADGKVYRIKDAITIPKKSASAPGSIEASVYADQPGESYNIGLTDFTVPGLKGDPRFETVYARSKTPMTGGLVGTRKKVSDENLAKAKSDLATSLTSALADQAKAQVPSDFILFPNLASITYEDLPQSNPTDTGTTVNVRGNFYGVMFKRSDLASYLAEKKGQVSATDPVDMPALDSLDLEFAGGVPADLLKVNQISFTVTGNATVVWHTDEEALKRDLAGKNKSDIATILKNYPSIAGAEATLRPFWKASFPSDPTRIKIKKQTVQ